jgi:microcystin-dependent protein
MSNPPNGFNSNSNFNKFKGTYFNSDVDCSGGNIICRNGNFYIGNNASIYSPMNRIQFDDVGGYINFSKVYVSSNFLIYNPTTLSNIDIIPYINQNNTNITSLNSSIATANSNITTLQTKLTNQTYVSGTNTTTWSGNISFPATSIASTSINNTSFCDLSNNQTIGGTKTFSLAPNLSGAGISSGSIPIASVVGTAVNLNSSQSISGQKSFSSTPLLLANLLLNGNLILNNNTLIILQSTLQKLQYLSDLSNVSLQSQLNQKIGLSNNNVFTGFNDFNNAASFNGQFYIASATPLIQIENGNTLRQWSNGVSGDTVMELAFDKGASTPGWSIQGGSDGTRGLFGLYFCTNVAAGTRLPIMYSKDTGTQANNVLTISSGTTACTNLTFSGTLNNKSSTTFGYLDATSSIQQQLDNKANLTTTNNFTGGNTFLGQLASGYNASGTIYGSQTEMFLTGHRPYANGGDPTNGSNVFEISLDTGFYKRGFTIQGGESSTNTSSAKRSIFGLYYRTFVGSGTDPIRTPIMYGTDQETGSSLDNTLTIPSSLRMTGTLKLDGGSEISNTQLAYLTTLSENVQSAVNTLKTKLTDLVWTSGTPNKTTIVNTTETSTLTFSNTLNGISTTVFGFLSGLTENITDTFASLKARTPVGSIIMYPRGDLGSPFVYCDGRELNRTTVAALFAIIGVTYGAGDGSTTFNIPDMRAIFLRGYGNRTINGVAYASTTGSTLQIDAMEAHTHSSNLSGTFLKTGTTFNVPGWTNGSNRPNESSAPASTGGVNTAFRTSNETRPLNLPVFYYICAS